MQGENFDTEQGNHNQFIYMLSTGKTTRDCPKHTKQINKSETRENRKSPDARKDERGGDENGVMKEKEHMGEHRMGTMCENQEKRCSEISIVQLPKRGTTGKRVLQTT